MIYSYLPKQDATRLECTECRCHDISKASAAERSDDWHERIAPVGAAFAGNREDCMRDARAEVTGGVHCVARRTTEGEAERPDEDTDDVRAIARNHVAD